MGLGSEYYEPQIWALEDTVVLLKKRLAHYEEELARLTAHKEALHAANDRLQNAFVDVNLDCDRKLDEAQDIVVDLLATGERLATQLEDQQSMKDSHNGWWNPSFATARVWIAQKNKR
jgi:chromosome segregation ATPase